MVTPERIELNVAAGQAKFRVARNPARSFVTRAAGHTVAVMGTVYTVALTADALEVSVDEGVADVARDDGTGCWRVYSGDKWSTTLRASADASGEPLARSAVGASCFDADF
jgi:ferric-dicitrate binding protein FerR (iron transport regulator)